MQIYPTIIRLSDAAIIVPIRKMKVIDYVSQYIPAFDAKYYQFERHKFEVKLTKFKIKPNKKEMTIPNKEDYYKYYADLISSETSKKGFYLSNLV